MRFTLFFGCLLIPQSPAVAKSCSNPRAHKAEVHYRRGHWLNPDLVGEWSHSPALPFPQHTMRLTLFFVCLLIPQSPASQNPAQILVPTRPRCTTGEGHWFNPDLVSKWSHSPGLPFPQHADELLSDPQSFCLFSSLALPRFSVLSHPPSPSVFPPSTPW